MSVMPDDSDNDGPVGYRKPPRRTRFKKGQSGNPRGRPKSARSPANLFWAVMAKSLIVTENGSRKKISMLEAILTQLANQSASGKFQATKLCLELLKYLESKQRPSLTLADLDTLISDVKRQLAEQDIRKNHE
jgi:hypothetical protein